MSGLVPENSVLAVSADGEYAAVFFWCPGCKCAHKVWLDPLHPNEITKACWSWNGDYVKPTIKPSIKVSGSKFTAKGESEYQAWMDDGCPPLPKDHQFESMPQICHSYVIDGNIAYCTDSTHELAGKTVPLTAKPFEQ